MYERKHITCEDPREHLADHDAVNTTGPRSLWLFNILLKSLLCRSYYSAVWLLASLYHL